MKGFVYFIANAESGPVKIGYSLDPDKRLKQVQSGSHLRLTVLDRFRASEDAERLLHRLFRPTRLAGEWFEAREGILEFAARVRINHSHRVMKLEGMQEWPTTPEAAAALAARFDAVAVREADFLRAAADLYPEQAFSALGLRRRPLPPGPPVDAPTSLVSAVTEQRYP